MHEIIYGIRTRVHEMMYEIRTNEHIMYEKLVRNNLCAEEIRNDAQHKTDLCTDKIAKLTQNDLYADANIDLYDMIRNNLYNDKCRSEINVDEMLPEKRTLKWIDLYDDTDIDLHDMIRNNLYTDECCREIDANKMLI